MFSLYCHLRFDFRAELIRQRIALSSRRPSLLKTMTQEPDRYYIASNISLIFLFQFKGVNVTFVCNVNLRLAVLEASNEREFGRRHSCCQYWRSWACPHGSWAESQHGEYTVYRLNRLTCSSPVTIHRRTWNAAMLLVCIGSDIRITDMIRCLLRPIS